MKETSPQRKVTGGPGKGDKATNQQRERPLNSGHGGPRLGAGRPPVAERAWVQRNGREWRVKGAPVHVTTKVLDGLPDLRRRPSFEAVLCALEGGKDRFGFRLNHYSIQSNHLHLIAEATEREALRAGMQGLLVRLAKGLNRTWGRKGDVFRDRYHDHVLRTPTEVRSALEYVLKNGQHHGVCRAGRLDPCSSAAAFDGWRGRKPPSAAVVEAHPIVLARTWLLRTGWRRRGLIPLEGASRT